MNGISKDRYEVMIGKHIPAGTGMKKYRDVHLNTELKTEEEAELDDEDLLALDMEQGELEAAVEEADVAEAEMEAADAVEADAEETVTEE